MHPLFAYNIKYRNFKKIHASKFKQVAIIFLKLEMQNYFFLSRNINVLKLLGANG
jgi:hypothetical protein